MPLPIIGAAAALGAKAIGGIAAGTAARAVAGTAARTVAGQAAKTTAQQTARYGVGRTASGQMLQATKPRKQWDWSNMASNFTPSDGG